MTENSLAMVRFALMKDINSSEKINISEVDHTAEDCVAVRQIAKNNLYDLIRI